MGDEKIRWGENVTSLDIAIANVIGDVLAASGFVAYLGPFTVRINFNFCNSLLDLKQKIIFMLKLNILWESKKKLMQM